jgi:hypothetical protein
MVGFVALDKVLRLFACGVNDIGLKLYWGINLLFDGPAHVTRFGIPCDLITHLKSALHFLNSFSMAPIEVKGWIGALNQENATKTFPIGACERKPSAVNGS